MEWDSKWGATSKVRIKEIDKCQLQEENFLPVQSQKSENLFDEIYIFVIQVDGIISKIDFFQDFFHRRGLKFENRSEYRVCSQLSVTHNIMIILPANSTAILPVR